jgi:hypothetical protein
VRKSYLWRLTSPQPSLPAVASTPPEKINRALGRTRIRATSPWTRDKGRRHRATRRWRAHQRVDAHADERACGGAITTSPLATMAGGLWISLIQGLEKEKERKESKEMRSSRKGEGLQRRCSWPSPVGTPGRSLRPPPPVCCEGCGGAERERARVTGEQVARRFCSSKMAGQPSDLRSAKMDGSQGRC